MSETGKELIFSESIKAGKRVYYFDVKQSRNGDNYITITESKKTNEGTPDNPRVVFEKHKLFLYKEDYEKFVGALNKVISVAQQNALAADGEVLEQLQADAAKDDAVAQDAAKEDAAAQDAVVADPQQAEEPKVEKKSFLDKMKGIF